MNTPPALAEMTYRMVRIYPAEEKLILFFGSLPQLVEATREYGPGCYVVEKIPAEGEPPRGGHAERRWGAIVRRIDGEIVTRPWPRLARNPYRR